jgi:Na+/proline symporter
VAYSAYVYRFGISAFAVFIGTAIGFLVFIPYALKLRKFSGEKQFYTLSDWFYFKFNKPTGLFSAIILLIVYSGMLLNQFIAGSSLLASISGWSYETGLLLSAALIVTYLLAGGFRSVIRTDIFQYLVLLVIIILIASVIFQDKKDFAFELVDFSRMNAGMTIAFTAFGIFIIFQSAEYWQRVYGARSDRIVRDGFILSAIFTVITGIAITIVGLAAHRHLLNIEAKDAFAKGLTLLLPRKLLGASLIMIFAAIMSAADTQIFVLASSVAVDWYDKLSGRKSDDKRRMLITRLGIIGVSLFSCIGAYFLRDLVAVIIFITGIGFTIIPASIASFHWKISSSSALLSFISGIAYIFTLILVASFKSSPMEFFKDNADLAILSVVVSALTLLIANLFSKTVHHET